MLSRLCCQNASGNQLRGSWPSMSPSPVLPSKEGNQYSSGGLRSQSFGARRVLGERDLNTHADRSPGTVKACWVLFKPWNSLPAWTCTRHNIKHVGIWLSRSLNGACSAWLRMYMYVLKESCSQFWHVWLLTKEGLSAEVLASSCNIRLPSLHLRVKPWFTQSRTERRLSVSSGQALLNNVYPGSECCTWPTAYKLFKPVCGSDCIEHPTASVHTPLCPTQ